MATSPLPAHSLVEAVLFVQVTPCPTCGHGAVEVDAPRVEPGGRSVRLIGTCTNCGATAEHRFDVPCSGQSVDPISAGEPINATDRHSQLIDVAQWITLHVELIEAAQRTPDRQESRWLRHRAGQCIDEALKFYDAHEDQPPPDAAFSDRSRSALRDHPDRFSRRHLIECRAKLPAVDAPAIANTATKRPWWKFWH